MGALRYPPRVALPAPGKVPVAQRKGAEIYRHVCARLGQQPTGDIVHGIHEDGSVVVDLQLCRSIDVLVLLLREAPSGIHQLILYDGLFFFGGDACYREKQRAWALQRRRQDEYEVRLRDLFGALAAFCSIRGTGLAKLELTGLPLGREVPWLLAPLVRSLEDLPSLQWLHLGGCSLHDRGLRLLLPHLALGLPKLSHLSLARNGLWDIRALAQLLRGRTAAQRRGEAVPLCILDLSENPLLGAHSAASSRSGGSPPPRRRPGQADPFWRRQDRQRGAVSRDSLIRVVGEALQDGLLLRTLRLRSMNLRAEDLRPVLDLLFREAANVQAGCNSDWSLLELSLEGNPLGHEIASAVDRLLRQLVPPRMPSIRPASAARVRHGPREGPLSGSAGTGDGSAARVSAARVSAARVSAAGPAGLAGPNGPAPPAAPAAPADLAPADASPSPRRWARSRSLPLLETPRFLVEGDELPERDAVSEGEEDQDAVGSVPGHPAVLQDSLSSRSLIESALTVGVDAIPDRGGELGFGPPVPPLALYSSGELDLELACQAYQAPYQRADHDQVASQHFDLDATPGRDAVPPPRNVSRSNPRERNSLRFDRVCGILRQSSAVRSLPAGPEVLSTALDLLNSDTSLNSIASAEAILHLAEQVAELQQHYAAASPPSDWAWPHEPRNTGNEGLVKDSDSGTCGDATEQ